MTHARSWVGPGLFVVFGVTTLALSVLWNHAADGAWAFSISMVFALVLAVGGRSDFLRTVRGDADERGAQVTLITSNIVLNVAAVAAVVGAVIEQAHGVHMGPWTEACMVGGAFYLVTFLLVRARA